MFDSAAVRNTVGAFLIAAATVACIPHATWCRAEPFESFARTLRTPLRQQRLGKVLIFLHADDSDSTQEAPPFEVELLRRQLAELCRELSIAETEIAAADDLPDSTLSAPPDPAEWRALLKREKADAVVDVTWKSTKSGLAVRVSLLNERKVVWNGRARLRRKGTDDAAPTDKPKGAGASNTGAGKNTGSGKSGGTGSVMGPSLMGSVGGWPTAAWDSTGNAGSLKSGLNGSGLGNSPAGGTLPTVGDKPVDVPNLNAKIYEFARSHLGQQVGGGECFELAVEALAAAGAKPGSAHNDFGQETPLSDLLPGDILQFWTVRLSGPLGVWQLGDPGHTAIVAEVKGTHVSVYHQNIGGVKRVRQDVLDLGSLTSGQIIGYRAVAR